MATVLNWVPTHTQTTTRAHKRATGVAERIEFGHGSGRCAGFYRQQWKRADPTTAEEERKHAAKKARERELARQAWEREQREQREQYARERMEEQREREAWARRARGASEGKGGAGARDEARANEQEQKRRGDRPEGGREKAKADGSQRAAREKRVDFDSMRRPSYAEYDAAFVTWRESARREKTFDLRQLPLPPKGVVIEEAANSEAWGKNLNRAMLRWHPDKWVTFDSMLPDEASREALKQVVNGMFRAVLRAKERGPPPSARG